MRRDCVVENTVQGTRDLFVLRRKEDDKETRARLRRCFIRRNEKEKAAQRREIREKELESVQEE